MIELGKKVRCKVTGLVGVATARIEYYGGDVQVAIQGPVGADGKVPELKWCVESFVERVV